MASGSVHQVMDT